MLYGATQYNPPSRFLDEIPAALVEAVEGSRAVGRRRQASTFAGEGRSSGGGSSYSSHSPERSSMDRHRDEVVERALRPAPPQPSGADALGLRVGDDVRHGTFGEGVIIDMEGSGDKTQATVHFRDAGQKVLLLSWAPLEKL